MRASEGARALSLTATTDVSLHLGTKPGIHAYIINIRTMNINTNFVHFNSQTHGDGTKFVLYPSNNGGNSAQIITEL